MSHSEYTENVTRTYIQYRDFPKVAFPVDVPGSTELNFYPEMKQGFDNDQVNGRNSQNIVFNFYTEYADTGNIYIGTAEGDRLWVFCKKRAKAMIFPLILNSSASIK
ncbi:hypothetical protein [Riemerella columbina]|uniref:hypothetical protein n=1 Tax=Riemerella columbina TaxID=103810 RepID=UPI00266EF67D|nr:hypothetical protein [Riemerella columbina]WKS95108.1 hypothetical protein NYR17_09360 [Riemerella columbina]